MEDLKTEFLFEVSEELQVPEEVSATRQDPRRLINITGGSVTGPKLQGEVLAGGNHWVRVRPDGVFELDARLTLHTDDGHLVYTAYQGIVHAPPDITLRLRQGESNIDPSAYYYRTTLTFETGPQGYDWLNRTVAVGVGKRTSTGVTYSVYAVL